MNPSATSIRALLGSLGLLTGLAGCGSDGGTPQTTPDSGTNQCGVGNAVACQPDGGGDSGQEASTRDAGQDVYVPPCGNSAICDAGLDSSEPADASPEAMADGSTDAGADGPFGCGTGNGPVCPPDASE